MKEITTVLSDEERLAQLTAEYYTQAGKGCLPAIADLAMGKTQRRAQEISKILGITDQEVMQVFTAVNLISITGDKEVALQNLYDSFMKGTHGGQRTGIPDRDKKIEKIATFAKTALEERWKLKTKQVN